MDRVTIFNAIKAQIAEILPHIDVEDVKLQDQLADHGANSIDRAEIVTNAMRELRIVVPPHALSRVENIEDLVDVFREHAQQQAREDG
jgi:polyketide biosynthesis acyl carrier protein